MSRIPFLVILFCLFIFCASAAPAADEAEALKAILSSSSSYPVKKHLKLAIEYASSGKARSLAEELKVLSTIDPENSGAYKAMIEGAAVTEKASDITAPAAMAENGKESDVVSEKFERAQDLYKKSKLQEARSMLVSIIEIDPRNKQAKKFMQDIDSEEFVPEETKPFQNLVKDLYNEGMASYRKGMFEEAESKFRKALDMDPKNTQAGNYSALAQEKMAAAKAETEKAGLLDEADRLRNKGEIKKARENYEKALKYEPENRRALFYVEDFDAKSALAAEKAGKLAAGNDFDEAYRAAVEALAYNPENAAAKKLERTLKLEIADKNTEKKNKKEADKLYNKGVTYYSKGDYAQAVAVWKAVLEINPDDAEAAENIRRAEEKMAEAAGQASDNIKKEIAGADELFASGMLDKAKAKYEYVLRLEPENAAARQGLANIADLESKKQAGDVTKR